MAMDLYVRRYSDYEELLTYMEGSAAVIGTMMLPILDPADRALAREPARQLGLAFQLTNFIRDVAEDLDRDRVYLPLADLARFGLTPDDLRAAAGRGSSGPAVRALIRFEIARARAHYAAAAPGVPMLARTSQACIRTAFHLYAGILDEIERAGYEVFLRRAVVPNRRRLATAVRCLLTPAGTPVAVPTGDR
jgi:phytoene synthase